LWISFWVWQSWDHACPLNQDCDQDMAWGGASSMSIVLLNAKDWQQKTSASKILFWNSPLKSRSPQREQSVRRLVGGVTCLVTVVLIGLGCAALTQENAW
jgi:hypothetical protein